jgi:flagellar hook-associated protein 2
MANPINVSGLSSGIQWGDIVDTTVKALEARSVTPISNTIAKRTAQKAAWTSFRTLVDTLNTSARALRSSGFGGFQATVPPSAITSRTLLTASPTENAVAGRYRVEVLQLAESAKIAGNAVANTGTALGQAGEFTINGKTIVIAATDTLRNVQTKINAANTGTDATGVKASIVSEGGTAGRLVLTSSSAGSNGISIADGTGAMARELGFIDSRTKPISSVVQAAAAAMGMTVIPSPASIRVGTVLVTADLAIDSLAQIAAKINAAGGSASVEPEAFGDETRYRLLVEGPVTADDADGQAIIDALGFAAGSPGRVRQTVQSPVYTDSVGATATATTALAGVQVDGVSAGLAVGDAINIRGVRGDGTAVTIGLIVQTGDTMQSLLDRLNNSTSGFGSGTRTASAALGADGRIRLTDDTGGASRLSFSMTVSRADGSAGRLGSGTVSVVGRSRELQEGRDAVIRVDGREVTRASNTITDAISGVTLSLTSAEPGSSIDVSIDRDVKGSTAAVQKLVDTFNEIRTFFDLQREPDSALYANSSLRGVVDSFNVALRTKVATNESYTSLAVTGLALDRTGKLAFDKTKFEKALNEKPNEIEALFGFTGAGTAFVTATDNATRFGVGTISTQVSSIDANTVALRLRETAARNKLEQRRERLVADFTRMEDALSRLQSQSGTLLSSVNGLQSQR